MKQQRNKVILLVATRDKIFKEVEQVVEEVTELTGSGRAANSSPQM